MEIELNFEHLQLQFHVYLSAKYYLFQYLKKINLNLKTYFQFPVI